MTKNHYKNSVLLTIFALLCTAAHTSRDACQSLNNAAPQSTQIVLVTSVGGFKAEVNLCQRQGSQWKQSNASPFQATIGKNGLAAPGTKKEGDLKTPAGLYPIGEAFGTTPMALKMDYKYITAQDKFIDDPTHKHYNTWVFGATDAKSYESMLVHFYAFGAVINYNRNRTVPGAGSAIFIHIWLSPDRPTHGCIALDKKQLLTLLHWLDKAKHPYIFVH